MAEKCAFVWGLQTPKAGVGGGPRLPVRGGAGERRGEYFPEEKAGGGSAPRWESTAGLRGGGRGSGQPGSEHGASSGSRETGTERDEPSRTRSFRLDGRGPEVYRMEDNDSEVEGPQLPRQEHGPSTGRRELGVMPINVASWHRHGAAAPEAAE